MTGRKVAELGRGRHLVGSPPHPQETREIRDSMKAKDINSLAQRISALETRVSELKNLFHGLRDAPRQENDAGVAPTQATKQEDNSASRKMPLRPQVPPPPRNRDQTNKPWYKTMNGWKVLLELIGIPFAIGYAIVTYFQWRDLRDNFQADHRSVIKVGIDDKEMKRFETDIAFLNAMTIVEVPLMMQNVGKTPALYIRTTPRVLIIPSTSEPPFFDPPYGYPTLTNSILFAGDVVEFRPSMHRSNRTEAAVITDEERAGLLSGKYYIVYFGRLEYSDEFGPHWSRYCGWRAFASDRVFQSGSCVQYNQIDAK